MEPLEVEPVQWPKAKIGGTEYTFRASYASNQQMVAWGFVQGAFPIAVWAAAMAGNFDKDGKWRSARFAHWLDAAELVTPAEASPLADAVHDAIKEVAREAVVTTLLPEPATAGAPN